MKINTQQLPSTFYHFDSNQFLPTCWAIWLWIPSWDHLDNSVFGEPERGEGIVGIFPEGLTEGIMMIYFQDLLWSVMVLIFPEMPTTEVPKHKSAPSSLWWNRGNKHSLEPQAMPTQYKEQRIHSGGGQTLKPKEHQAFPSFSTFKLHKPWICFGQEAG